MLFLLGLINIITPLIGGYLSDRIGDKSLLVFSNV